MKTYLYHAVPANMIGHKLIPLNSMRYIDRPTYNAHYAKYTGREYITQQYIPSLDCLWNDVIFLTAIHPETLAETFASCGMRLRKTRFFRIDANDLDAHLATVWLYEKEEKQPQDFKPFDPYDLENYSFVPQRTIDYYTHLMSEGRRNEILMFAFVPHIMYKGEIDTRRADIIQV